MTSTLIVELRRRGHFIRLYAAPGTDPRIADELIAYQALPELSAVAAIDPQLPEPDFLRDHHCLMGGTAHFLSHGGGFDLIHNQTLHYLPLTMSAVLGVPVVTTLHTPPFPWMELGIALASDKAHYVGVSEAAARQWTTLSHPATVIPNGVDTRRFPPGPGGESLAWIGRMVPEKGADLAVRVAMAAGRPIRLAGPIADAEWFDRVIRPMLSGQVQYLGHLNHLDTSALLGTCGAMLMVPRWDEPFGLVVAEAALSGTPTLGLARGGLPEVVDERIGVLVPTADHDDPTVGRLTAAIPATLGLPRAEVRAQALDRFSADRMAEAYEQLFLSLAAHRDGPRATPEPRESAR